MSQKRGRRKAPSFFVCDSFKSSVLVFVAEADGALIPEHNLVLGCVDCTPREHLPLSVCESAGSAIDNHAIGIGGGIQSRLAAGVASRIGRRCQDGVALRRDPVVFIWKDKHPAGARGELEHGYADPAAEVACG